MQNQFVGAFKLTPANMELLQERVQTRAANAALRAEDPDAKPMKLPTDNGSVRFNIDAKWYVQFSWDIFRQVETKFGVRQGQKEDGEVAADCPYFPSVQSLSMENGDVHYNVSVFRA